MEQQTQGAELAEHDVEAAIKLVKGRVAELLETNEDALDENESLEDQGLDSVRMVDIVSLLRAEGFEVDFADLIDDSTLANWKNVLRESAHS